MTRRAFFALGLFGSLSVRRSEATTHASDPSPIVLVASVKKADGDAWQSYYELRDQSASEAQGSAFLVGGDNDVPVVQFLRDKAAAEAMVQVTLR